MQHYRPLRRSALLALSLLSACAAAEPSGAATERRPHHGMPDSNVGGGAAALLAGRFAAVSADLNRAADAFLKALSLDSANADLRRQTFVSCLLAGRPEAVELANEQPGDPVAQLVLGNADAKAGDWVSAERRFAGLPRQGVTQLLQPMLVAWAQLGQGKPEAALATLKPFAEADRFRAVYSFHSALIADLASRPGDAARLYHKAQADFGTLNLDLARAIASWQARQGHMAEAKQILADFGKAAPDFALAMPRLEAAIAVRDVRRPADGMAAAYLALAVALRQQDSADYPSLLLRMALDLRPDMTTARLLIGEIAEQNKRPEAALAALEPVADTDVLAPVVDLRRASLQDRLGNDGEALRIAAKVAVEMPERPEAWSLQGDVLRAKHRYAEAAAAYDKAIALLPQPLTAANWPLFYERGITLERSHQWPRAEADFLHALQLSPDQPFVLNYLAYSWTEMGNDLPRARQMIMKAAEARPNDGAILDSLGWVTLRQGEVAAGVKWLEKASELETEDATINGHLGDAYWAAGRKLEASYQWQRAITLNPDPEDLPKLQAKLREARAALGVPEPAPVPVPVAESASQ